jgi:hypothetical protein
MDWSPYKCTQRVASFNDCVTNDIPKPRCSDPKGFIFVKKDTNFDISGYNGELPVVVIYQGDTVIGWTEELTATSYSQLQPWKTNPPSRFFWGEPSVTIDLTYRQAIEYLRRHCQHLKDLNIGVPNQVDFEHGRQLLLVCALVNDCIDIQKLMQMEIDYMKIITQYDPNVITRCAKFHNLDLPTVEHLERHLRKQYESPVLSTTENLEFFKTIGASVANMLF